MKSFIEIT